MPDPGHASLGVSWVGHLRVCNSHGGSASGRASEACGCPFAGRDRHGDPLHTDQCSWRLLLALLQSQRQRPCLENGSRCCCASGLSRSAHSIGELRWRAGRFMHSSPASGRERVFRPPFHRVCPQAHFVYRGGARCRTCRTFRQRWRGWWRGRSVSAKPPPTEVGRFHAFPDRPVGGRPLV